MLRTIRLFAQTFIATVRDRARRGPLLPSWNFGFEWVIAFLRRDFAETESWPYARLRADLNARPYPRGELRGIDSSSESVAGIPAFRFKPRGQAHTRAGVVLYFHGGSYIFGSANTSHADVIARIATASGAEVLALDYRLAPEHPYPAALQDALAAFDALVASGTDPRHIVVGGDSAGGNLALVLQIALRDRGSAQAGAAVLISPWLDLTSSSASCSANDAVDYGARAMLLTQARAFADGVPLEDPRISPLFAKLDGLAPFLAVAGGAERLHDETVDLTERARRAGVEAELYVAPEMPHNPPVLAAYHPQGLAAVRAIGAYVTARLPALS